MPSASITSALPTDDVTARLPCLATATPAAAHRMATVVEMLNVLKRSPPVPTTSRISRDSRQAFSIGGGMDLSRSARAKAAISSGVSPLFAERGEKIGLQPGRNIFAGKSFDRLPYLRFCERLRGVELLDQLFERFRHERIVKPGASGSNRKLHGQTD